MRSLDVPELTGEEMDALDGLGDEIVSLAAQIHAATHRLLTLLREFDRRRGWAVEGHASCAHWLSFRTGMDRGTAREKVRVARAMAELPQVSAAMERGELSFAKVRCITRVANAECEAELLGYAQTSTAAELERMVRGWRRLDRLDETERERRRHLTRCVSVFPDDDGMYLLRGRLDPEVGVALMRAIEAASDVLYRRGSVAEVEPEQRRADALGLLAEAALASGMLGEAGCAGDAASDGDVARQGAGVQNVPRVSGLRAERYQVVLHVDATKAEAAKTEAAKTEAAKTEAAKTEAAKTDAAKTDALSAGATLEDGTRVSAETSRRLACDASVVRVTRGDGGGVLDVGRRTRTIPPALRRALEVRDGGCRFPGCGSRFTDGHHIVHWADGGTTSLDNTMLLCRYHHRLVHEGGYRVERGPTGRLNFYTPRGLPLPDVPSVPDVPGVPDATVWRRPIARRRRAPAAVP
ncbi:MAG TPA: DUF222 domain-containing protein [Longimicrobiales bacterium]|nr:DUF222 domain-containing protein [Longimicrobiales bacterium]